MAGAERVVRGQELRKKDKTGCCQGVSIAGAEAMLKPSMVKVEDRRSENIRNSWELLAPTQVR